MDGSSITVKRMLLHIECSEWIVWIFAKATALVWGGTDYIVSLVTTRPSSTSGAHKVGGIMGSLELKRVMRGRFMV